MGLSRVRKNLLRKYLRESNHGKESGITGGEELR